LGYLKLHSQGNNVPRLPFQGKAFLQFFPAIGPIIPHSLWMIGEQKYERPVAWGTTGLP
jgi:hypothetical protein